MEEGLGNDRIELASKRVLQAYVEDAMLLRSSSLGNIAKSNRTALLTRRRVNPNRGSDRAGQGRTQDKLPADKTDTREP